MKVVRFKKSLPKNWSTHPRIKVDSEFDVRLGSLYAKVLIFKNSKDLHGWWKCKIKSHYLPKGDTLGAVNGLFYESIPQKGKPYLQVDPRYFCVIALTKNNLTMEVITHESVHAAYCFIKRKSRTPWAKLAKENDEEEVAYPAGRIAAAINRELYKRNLYGDNQ